MCTRRTQTISDNDTKIKYISIAGKIYEVIKISFFYMIVEAVQTGLTKNDVSESEVWDIGEFRDYKVKLINNGGKAEIIDFADYKEKT